VDTLHFTKEYLFIALSLRSYRSQTEDCEHQRATTSSRSGLLVWRASTTGCADPWARMNSLFPSDVSWPPLK